MKKILFTIILSLAATHSYAQCHSQNKYNAKWKIQGDNAQINIIAKDNGLVEYYDLAYIQRLYYIGFRIVNKQVIYKDMPDNNVYGAISMSFPQNISNYDIDKVFKILYGNNNLINSSLKSLNISKVYKFPLDNEYLVKNSEYTNTFNIHHMIIKFKDLTEYNNIYNKQKVIFYVTLIHKADFSECSYFESPVVEYDFGRKPLKKYWNELFK